ncbi:CCT3 isoform 4 [Pan troglodytes]|uniref:Chaperonin containing TCP1 subunit 3 n=2 Tax=Homininae TaxID=207598 RepID=E9PRN0_HUMAN|nr:CCT3 isoform 4 [Pan troglodytes]
MMGHRPVLVLNYCRYHPNMFGTQVHDEDAFGPNGRHCDDQ